MMFFLLARMATVGGLASLGLAALASVRSSRSHTAWRAKMDISGSKDSE